MGIDYYSNWHSTMICLISYNQMETVCFESIHENKTPRQWQFIFLMVRLYDPSLWSRVWSHVWVPHYDTTPSSNLRVPLRSHIQRSWSHFSSIPNLPLTPQQIRIGSCWLRISDCATQNVLTKDLRRIVKFCTNL